MAARAALQMCLSGSVLLMLLERNLVPMLLTVLLFIDFACIPGPWLYT